jgi:hypothetical protein
MEVGWMNVISAGLLLIAAIFQKCYLSFDPLDSNFITYELCINLTS